VKYQTRKPLPDPQSIFEPLNTLSDLKEAVEIFDDLLWGIDEIFCGEGCGIDYFSVYVLVYV